MAQENHSHLSFSDRFFLRTGGGNIALCAGIDPCPDTLALVGSTPDEPLHLRAAAMQRIAAIIIDAVRDHAVAVKFQHAWFETAGHHGANALARAADYASRAGLMVIHDGKRGDIARSAEAYAQSWLGHPSNQSGVPGDALTVHPLGGIDSLKAMSAVALARGAALFSLVYMTTEGPTRSHWREFAEMANSADCGAVVAGNSPNDLAAVIEKLPNAPLLIPGIGAQGGNADELKKTIASHNQPVLICASRSILPLGDAHANTYSGDQEALKHLIAEAAREVLGNDLDLCTLPM